MRIVFLCSGGGGNLRFINQAINEGWLGPAKIVGVVTDRECGASQYSRQQNIETKVINFVQNDQLELRDCLSSFQPDLVITTVHKIIRESVLDSIGDCFINLHYSILPAFSGTIGLSTIKAAANYGAKIIGVTVHHVDKSVDGGKPIVQAAIPVRPSDEALGIMNIVFRCGCLSLLSAVQARCSSDSVKTTEKVANVIDRICMFSQSFQIPMDINDEMFWKKISEPI